MPASFSSTSYTPDGLLVGEDVVLSRQITLISGQNCARGAVLGKITVLVAIILFLQWRPAGIFVTKSRSLEG